MHLYPINKSHCFEFKTHNFTITLMIFNFRLKMPNVWCRIFGENNASRIDTTQAKLTN